MFPPFRKFNYIIENASEPDQWKSYRMWSKLEKGHFKLLEKSPVFLHMMTVVLCFEVVKYTHFLVFAHKCLLLLVVNWENNIVNLSFCPSLKYEVSLKVFALVGNCFLLFLTNLHGLWSIVIKPIFITCYYCPKSFLYITKLVFRQNA